MQWAQCFQSSKVPRGNLDSPSEAPQIPKNWTQNTKVQREVEVGRMHRSGETFCVQGIWAFLLARADGGTREEEHYPRRPRKSRHAPYFITVFQWESTSNAGP